MNKVKKGFLLAFCLNLIYRGEWFVWAVIAFIAHYLLGLPMFVFWILIGVWILISLFITIVLGWASGSDTSAPKRKNVNPYSKKTSDYLPKK